VFDFFLPTVSGSRIYDSKTAINENRMDLGDSLILVRKKRDVSKESDEVFSRPFPENIII
jgi:hypothetical protein